MRKFLCSVLLLCLSLAILAPPAVAQTKPAPESLKLKVGDKAPDFSLYAFDGKELKKYSLHDFAGKKNVALAFYVFAFTGG